MKNDLKIDEMAYQFYLTYVANRGHTVFPHKEFLFKIKKIVDIKNFMIRQIDF